jgi:hypothetical protein
VLAVAAEALPNPGAGVVPNNEVVDFVFPNGETLGVGLFVSPSGDFAMPNAKGLSSVEALGFDPNDPLYGGFVSAFSPLGRSEDGVLGASPLDLPLVDPNAWLGFRIGFAEPVILVASRPSTTDPGSVLAGFGEGDLSF